MTPDDLSPADRELAQHWIMKLYLKARQLDHRGYWARNYVREPVTGYAKPRLHAVKPRKQAA